MLDPMLATGGSLSSDTCRLLVERGAPQPITVVCVLAAPEGLDRIRRSGMQTRIVTAAIDSHLNDKAYIVLGLGDAGDRPQIRPLLVGGREAEEEAGHRATQPTKPITIAATRREASPVRAKQPRVRTARDPAVLGVGGGEAEAAEDDEMCFSTAPPIRRGPRDPRVRPALGHQGQHLALAAVSVSSGPLRRRASNWATTSGSSTVPPAATRWTASTKSATSATRSFSR